MHDAMQHRSTARPMRLLQIYQTSGALSDQHMVIKFAAVGLKFHSCMHTAAISLAKATEHSVLHVLSEQPATYLLLSRVTRPLLT